MYTPHTHPQPPASFPPASSSTSWQGQDGRLPRTHGLPYPDFHQGPPHPVVYHEPESGASRTVHAQHRFDPYGRPAGYPRLPPDGYPMYPAYPGFPGDGNFMPAYNPTAGPQRGPTGPMVQPMPRPEVPPQRRRNYQKKPYPDGCHVCGTSATPEWRRGPSGLRTLCNACGLSAKKFKHDPPKDLDQCVKQLLEIGRARQRTAEEHVRSPENMLRVTQSFNSRFDKDDAPRPRATSHASRRSSAGSASPPRAALQLSPTSFSHPHGFADQRLDPNYTDAEMDSATLLCSLGGGSPSSTTSRPLPGGQSQRESDVAHALASMREGNSPQSNRTAPLPVIDPIFAHLPMIDPIFMTHTDAQAPLADQERPTSSSSRSSGGNPMAISSLVENK